MGLTDIFYSVFCCRCYVQQEIEEKDAILRTSLFSASEQSHDPEQALWNSSRTPISTAEPQSDQELHAFIMMRNQVDKDTEEWEKLNYDIHTLKCAQREVITRWRKILLQLGYQGEVDGLLMVSRQGTLSDCGNRAVATELLQTLWAESSLFPAGYCAHDRYLFVMVLEQEFAESAATGWCNLLAPYVRQRGGADGGLGRGCWGIGVCRSGSTEQQAAAVSHYLAL
ncbi:hypothetical protein SKAU_G00254350 [Synaphobranchus kaupii]|uniref:Melanoregulin n=1 Tax=Synaphobranchus kaupii TaxID=118154 RepID=A0A9Q1F3R7_SYNKA|nr:hypothetical protein SKAU_G00254350 [Synaphobranchus kaupii]